MAKIYEGDIKLTNVQVTEVLMNEMPVSHMRIIGEAINKDTKGFRKQFAHAVLDAYKFLPTDTESEEKSKKYCKFLMERYMKSITAGDNDESVMQLLVSKINKHCETITA